MNLNRNYGEFWGADDQGSSFDPCSEVYRGSQAFSEPESRAVAGVVERERPGLAISYHGGGQDAYILPFGPVPRDTPSLFHEQDDYTFLHSLPLPPSTPLGNPSEVLGSLSNGNFPDYAYSQHTLAFEARVSSEELRK